MNKIKQFDDGNIYDLGPGNDGCRYWFECAMISTCEPLFDNCGSNYEVEEKLRKAGVLRNLDTDTESCALIVNFKTMRSARAFITRLNKYLREKAEVMKLANDF